MHQTEATISTEGSGELIEDAAGVSTSSCDRYMLWIDGVGTWQVCMGDAVVLGAPSREKQPADIALLANVSRQHATISRSTASWILEAHQQTFLCGDTVSSVVSLNSGDEIRLGESVRLGFRVPSVLSTSAVIDFESEHRPNHSVDGVILLSDHCLLGPRKDHHICCPAWPDAVVLFRRGRELRCRSKRNLYVNDRMVHDSELLTHGDTVSSDEFRFRIEQLDRNAS